MEEGRIVELAKLALLDELFAAKIYSMAAGLSKIGSTRDRLLKISKMEEGHADFWSELLRKRGVDPSEVQVGFLKTFLYAVFLRLFGLALTFRLMESGERDAVELYSRMLGSSELDEDEKDMLKKILEDELVHEQELSEEESRFIKLLDHIRDAVLGMNDGLVEILSVTMGLAGAYGSSFYVALSGVVVAIAGALSMGIGAFVAARAQKQVHEGILGRIGLAIRYVAGVFRDRIRSIMLAKGYSEEVSERIAAESSRNPKLMMRTISEEEYGVRVEKLENPTAAGFYTGLAYLLSSFLPILPYLLGLPIIPAMLLSLLIAGLSLSFTGLVIAISADLPIKKKILEMVLAGFGSAIVTYLIGKLFSMIFGVAVA